MSLAPPDAAASLTGTPDAFAAACHADMDHARAEIARLKAMAAPRETDTALAAFDGAMDALGNAGARASVCRNAHPDQKMRDAADHAEQEIAALQTEISLDRGVYDALAGLDLGGQDPATHHYVGKTLRELRRSGVDRDEPTRARVKELRDELVRIGQEFGKNIIDDVRRVELDPADLDGLPEDYRRAHAPGHGGKCVISTDSTDYVPFMTYARSAAARERLWREYRLRAHPANLAVLDRMLARRHDLATLLGYPTWAAYATEDKMIRSAEAAAEFVARIAAAAEERGTRDYEQLLARKRRDEPGAERVWGWDSAYYEERVSAEEYGFDSQAVRPYFEYERVKRGVLDVTAKLFGLTYAKVTGARVWHDEVDVYDVHDATGRLGRIYLDMHPREGKYKHFAQFTLASGVRGRRLPEGALMCNFARPSAQAPALLEHSDVKTFFHEFGHLLHHVLGGHVRWAGLSGVATEWDFVEAPSQMLEEWVWDPATLRTFARHYETDEPIPSELIARARAADEYGKGLWVRQQMYYAAVSLELHARDPQGLDTTKLVAELQERLTPFKYVSNSFFHESFGHLIEYTAIYYTYMWSLVIAKDMFSRFKQHGLFDTDTAAKYRHAVLEPGGSKPAAELVHDFLGREYAFDAYGEWLSR
jgi:Zn-dependent oligopeptidase